MDTSARPRPPTYTGELTSGELAMRRIACRLLAMRVTVLANINVRHIVTLVGTAIPLVPSLMLTKALIYGKLHRPIAKPRLGPARHEGVAAYVRPRLAPRPLLTFLSRPKHTFRLFPLTRFTTDYCAR